MEKFKNVSMFAGAVSGFMEKKEEEVTEEEKVKIKEEKARVEKETKAIQSIEIYTGHQPMNGINIVYKGFIVANKIKPKAALEAGMKEQLNRIKKSTEEDTIDRNDLLWEAKQKAHDIGATAIIGLRMDTNSMYEGMVYGTAIYFDKPEDMQSMR